MVLLWLSYHATINGVLRSRNLLPDQESRATHQRDVDGNGKDVRDPFSPRDGEGREGDKDDDKEHEACYSGRHIQHPGIHGNLSGFLPHMPAHSHTDRSLFPFMTP